MNAQSAFSARWPLLGLVAILLWPGAVPADDAPELPQEWEATVVSVTDGDTLRVRGGAAVLWAPVILRLQGIDTPELRPPGRRGEGPGQALGAEAKRLLHQKLQGQTVRVRSVGRDKYGRVLAWVYTGPRSVNWQMVREGYAWAYKQYLPAGHRLFAAEQAARSERLGIWSLPPEQRSPPWVWRRNWNR